MLLQKFKQAPTLRVVSAPKVFPLRPEPLVVRMKYGDFGNYK